MCTARFVSLLRGVTVQAILAQLQASLAASGVPDGVDGNGHDADEKEDFDDADEGEDAAGEQ